MELSRILITEYGDHQVIYLKEIDGERSFPIMIGIAEAMAIDRRVKGQKFPRPLTHDLLGNVIEAMGGGLERIVVNDLRDHTFIATLHIDRDGEHIEIDARPSDAIALGVAFETPIFVAEHVLQQVLTDTSTPEQRLDLLRQRRDALAERIAEMDERLRDAEFVSQAPQTVLDEYRRQMEEMQVEQNAIDEVLHKFGQE
jgi:hypothetical protein